MQTPPNYKDVIIGFIFSMHSRRFVMSIVTMSIVYYGAKAGIPNETLGLISAIAGSFIVGESVNDAARNKAVSPVPETVTAGGDVTVSTPASEPVIPATEPAPDFPTSIHQPQNYAPEPPLSVEVLDDTNLPGRSEDFDNDAAVQEIQRQAVIEQEAQSG